jgi:inosine-uridine nucleoside N-ribohydrolase
MEGKVRPIKNSISKFVIEATGYDLIIRQFRNKELLHLHDPLAVGVVIDPDLVKKERLSLHVETQEGKHYGRTSQAGEGPKVNVCLGVDSQKFLGLFMSRLTPLAPLL